MPYIGLYLKNVGKLQLVKDFICLRLKLIWPPISQKASLGNKVYNAATKLLNGTAIILCLHWKICTSFQLLIGHNMRCLDWLLQPWTDWRLTMWMKDHVFRYKSVHLLRSSLAEVDFLRHIGGKNTTNSNHSDPSSRCGNLCCQKPGNGGEDRQMNRQEVSEQGREERYSAKACSPFLLLNHPALVMTLELSYLASLVL